MSISRILDGRKVIFYSYIDLSGQANTWVEPKSGETITYVMEDLGDHGQALLVHKRSDGVITETVNVAGLDCIRYETDPEKGIDDDDIPF